MPPRGGRGGAGAGRPRPPPGKVRIGGIDIEADEDTISSFDRPRPRDTFPPYAPSQARPISCTEATEIGNYRSIRARIHKGPLYTTFDDVSKITKPGQKRRPAAATFDAFNGMETYSMRYSVKKRTIPRLDTRPYVLKFFPEELHSILDPFAVQAKGSKAAAPKRRKQLQTGFDPAELEEVEEIKEDDDEDAVNRKAPEDADELPDEDVDDDFDEDDEDADDDYNAEQYFDDGGDDAGDDADGGDGEQME